MKHEHVELKNKPKPITRYVIYIDGLRYGWGYYEDKIKEWVGEVEEHYANQDLPYFPKIEIKKEVIYATNEET